METQKLRLLQNDRMTVSQLAGIAGFIIGFITIWIHLEVCIAGINVDLANLKQELNTHRADNRRDLELLKTDFTGDTREILRKVDEIQIYLRNNRELKSKN